MIYFLITGTLIGILLSEYIGMYSWLGILLMVVTGIITYWFLRVGGKQSRKVIAAISCIGIGCLLSVLRIHQVGPVLQNPLESFVGNEVVVTGYIDQEPEKRERTTQIIVQTRQVNSSDSQGIRILLTVPHYPEYEYGQEITVTGEIGKPSSFVTDAGREFEYQMYLGKSKIWYTMLYPQIELNSSRSGWKGYVFALKKDMVETLAKYLPEPHSSLAAGLLVGAKESLGTELLDAFRRVGLIHIVVLSGFNVAVIIIALRSATNFLPISEWVRFCIIVTSIIVFVIMVGAGMPIVRAALMASLGLLGILLGRDIDGYKLVAISAWILILVSPHILLHGASFQLSFIATLSLVAAAQYFVRHQGAKWIPKQFGLREYIVTTVVTQIAVTPLLLYLTGEVSVVSLLANVLVLPVIPLIMLLVFLVLVMSAVPVIATVVAWAAYVMLMYVFWIVKMLSDVPYAVASISHFPVWAMIFSYIVLIAGWIHIYKKVVKNTEK